MAVCPLPSHPQAVIGLDFGTATTCAAILRNGKVNFIKGKYGQCHVIPTVVLFTPDDCKHRDRDSILAGDMARRLDQQYKDSVVFGMKRFLGRGVDDPALACEKYFYPFEIVSDRDKQVAFKLKGEGMLSPDKVSAIFLKEIKESAEKQLACNVDSAVVTVPSSYGFFQCQKIKDVCTSSGLKVVRLIDEATSVALAHGRLNPSTSNKNVLVVSIGAAFVSVSLVYVKHGRSYEVQAVSGVSSLGGNSFDSRVTSCLVEQIRALTGTDITLDNKVMMNRLRKGALALKENLTEHELASVNVDMEGEDVVLQLTRTEFEKLNADLFAAILEPVKRTLQDAQLTSEAVDDVVLAGGSARIPYIQRLLYNFFGKKSPAFSFSDCTTLSAVGAAILAANLQGHEDEFIRDLVQVIPYSIGIETEGNKITKIIDRSTKVPKLVTKTFSTYSDYQGKALIAVYEGDRPSSKDNVRLGQIVLKNIREEPQGFPEIDVTVHVDHDYAVTVKVLVIASDQLRMSLKVTLESLLEKPYVDLSKPMAITSREPSRKVEDHDWEHIDFNQAVKEQVAEDVVYRSRQFDGAKSGFHFKTLKKRQSRVNLSSLVESFSTRNRQKVSTDCSSTVSEQDTTVGRSDFGSSQQDQINLQHVLSVANAPARRFGIQEQEAIRRAETAEIQARRLEKERDIALQRAEDLESDFQALQEQNDKLQMDLTEVREQADLYFAQYSKVSEILKEKEAAAINPEALWVIQRNEIKLLDEEVGRGGWGIVTKAMFRGKCVAAKRMYDHIISEYNCELLQREMNIASRIRHPNLVQFIGATAQGQLIIVTELMATSLWKELQLHPFKQSQIDAISLDVARALNYLHLMRPEPIIHRDVSSSNVLLNPGPNETWLAKLSDYGSANYVYSAVTRGPGNAAYAAPDRFQTPQMDVYSFGVLLLEMCTRKIPDSKKTDREELIGKVPHTHLQNIIRLCTKYCPFKRPTISETIENLMTACYDN